MKKIKKYWVKVYRVFVLPFANRRYMKRAVLFESLPSVDPAKLFVVTVAFNDLDLIVLHWASLQKFLQDPFEYFIFDNSSDELKAGQIKQYCLGQKINYIRLPYNRYRTTIPLASHSFALNWIYHNFIKKFNPKFFGVWDCDLFPLRPIIIIPKLQERDTWGIIRKQKPRFRPWESGLHVWIGLDFFRLEKFSRHAPNFMPRFGVDVGGRIVLDPKIAENFPERQYHDDLRSTDIAPRTEIYLNENFVHFGGSADFPAGLGLKKQWLEKLLGISKTIA